MSPTPVSVAQGAFVCPFEAPLHGEVERLERETQDWVRQHALVPPRYAARFARSRFAWLAARTYGDACFDDLRLANDFHVWLFVRDDGIDDVRLVDAAGVLEGTGQRRALVEGAAPSAPPLERAIADIGERIRARGGRAWLGRFARHLDAYLAATRWERVNDRRAEPPAVPSYRLLRRATGAVQLCFDLGAMFHDVPADAPWLEHPCVTALECLANDHVTWTNDVFGFARERAEGNQNNLVSALVRAEGLEAADAIGAAIAACNSVVEAFLELEAALPSIGLSVSETAGHRRVMKRWMRGNLEWYGDTDRYRGQSGAYPRVASCAHLVEASG